MAIGVLTTVEDLILVSDASKKPIINQVSYVAQC